MRIGLVALCFLIVMLPVTAESVFSIDYGFDFSWYPQGGFGEVTRKPNGNYENEHEFDLANTFSLRFHGTFWLWELLFFGGAMEGQTHAERITSWNIDFVKSNLWAGMRWRFVELKWEHMCVHPVISDLADFGVLNVVGEGSWDKVTLSFFGSIGK